MADEPPRYVIFVEENGEEVMYSAPLADDDARYFLRGIVPNLRPLTDEEYMNGPAAILHTAARFSYVLYRDSVCWCVEWEPGLVVLRFSLDGTMAWTVLRSPVPSFAGRTPTEEDLRDYDEDDPNHQYNLVFRPWDAQFEEDTREYRGFTRADERTLNVYQAALENVNALGEELRSRYAQESDFRQWLEQSKAALTQRTGDGLRIKM